MIISKVFFFDVKEFWWGCFNGFYSLSDLCIAINVDDLLDEVTGLVSICLLLEPNDSLDDVFNEASEDKYSDKIIIVFCAIRTR